MAAFTSSNVVFLLNVVVSSVSEPVITGTLCAPPSNFPLSSGSTSPIAFAAPVLLGTMLAAAALALLRSPFACGASSVAWYDNEMSYVSQLVRTVQYMDSLIKK